MYLHKLGIDYWWKKSYKYTYMYIGNIKSIRVDFKNCVNTTLLVYLLFDLFVLCYTFIFFSQDETVPFSHLKSNWKVTEMWQNCRAMPFSHFSISFSYHSINWITEGFFTKYTLFFNNITVKKCTIFAQCFTCDLKI